MHLFISFILSTSLLLPLDAFLKSIIRFISSLFRWVSIEFLLLMTFLKFPWVQLNFLKMFHSPFLSVMFLHFIFFLTFIILFIHIIAICYTECYDFKVSLGLLRIRSFWFWIFVAFIVFADFLPTLIYFMWLVNFLMNLSLVGVVVHETHVLGWDFMEPRPFLW